MFCLPLLQVNQIYIGAKIIAHGNIHKAYYICIHILSASDVHPYTFDTITRHVFAAREKRYLPRPSLILRKLW